MDPPDAAGARPHRDEAPTAPRRSASGASHSDEAPVSGVSDPRYNPFVIGRRTRDEVQATRLLASLWRTEPASIGRFLGAVVDPSLADVGEWFVRAEVVVSEGRLDILVEAPGIARVAIEAKIDSGQGASQLYRYRKWLLRVGRPEERLALIYLTDQEDSLPDEITEPVGGRIYRACNVRWRDFALHLVERRDEQTLAALFVAMLAEEGLAVEPALTAEDWDAYNRTSSTLARLGTLVAHAAAAVSESIADLAPGSVTSDQRRIRCSLTTERSEIEFGFAANASRRQPRTAPIAFVRVRRRGITSKEKVSEAESAVRSTPAALSLVVSGPWAQRHTDAEELLGSASDGPAQQAVYLGFCREALAALAEAGFIEREFAERDGGL